MLIDAIQPGTRFVSANVFEGIVADRSVKEAPSGDRTPEAFRLPEDSRLDRVRRCALDGVYQWRNRLSAPLVRRRLRGLGAATPTIERADLFCWGNRGFGLELSLQQLRRRLTRTDRIVCFGCGTGEEILTLCRLLRPRSVVGVDFFNYDRAWRLVARAARIAHGCDVEFAQIDLRNATAIPRLEADVLFSNAVLEHLADLGGSLMRLRPMLADGGQFVSQWGPMWFSYGGDHIAADLGWERGFAHVELSPEEYWAFYREHPRNRSSVERNEPTWLELGLTCFARFPEYVAALRGTFGDPVFMKLMFSPEGAAWIRRFPGRTAAMVTGRYHVAPIDLVLQSALVVCAPIGPRR